MDDGGTGALQHDPTFHRLHEKGPASGGEDLVTVLGDLHAGPAGVGGGLQYVGLLELDYLQEEILADLEWR